MRTAISPRLATRTLLNILRDASFYLRAAGLRNAAVSSVAFTVFGATSRHASRICVAKTGFWFARHFTSILLRGGGTSAGRFELLRHFEQLGDGIPVSAGRGSLQHFLDGQPG